MPTGSCARALRIGRVSFSFVEPESVNSPERILWLMSSSMDAVGLFCLLLLLLLSSTAAATTDLRDEGCFAEAAAEQSLLLLGTAAAAARLTDTTLAEEQPAGRARSCCCICIILVVLCRVTAPIHALAGRVRNWRRDKRDLVCWSCAWEREEVRSGGLVGL